MLAPVSGGHFNPLVSLAGAVFGGMPRRHLAAYVPAQIAGCVTGAVLANLMFAAPAVSISTRHRATAAHGLVSSTRWRGRRASRKLISGCATARTDGLPVP
jgi:glycerol uptake facilitator-like aquaporin